MEKISVSHSGDVAVVTFTQPKFLDVADIRQLDFELFEVADSGANTILLDMSAVQFLSSAALNRLIMLHKCIKGKGKELQLAGITSDIARVFAITRLDTLFNILDEVPAA